MKIGFQLLIRPLLPLLIFLLAPFSINGQMCENQALAFDGTGDYISLALTPVLSGNLTVEAWFYTTNAASINRPIFSLNESNTSGPDIFELFLQNGQIYYYWDDGSGPLTTPVAVPPVTPDYLGAWHHAAMTINGPVFYILIDGSIVHSGVLATTLSFNTFFAGHSVLPTLDWDGQLDEIRLWNTFRNSNQIKDTKDCTISGINSSLLVNWTLNQNAVPDGPNPGITQAVDMSGSNHGILNGFDLGNVNPQSNFICNTCPPKFDIDLTDRPSLFPVSLAAICSGNSVHFCVLENGQPYNPIQGGTIDWQYSDDLGATWPSVTPSIPSYCFQQASIDVSTLCGTSTTGYVMRKYRAQIQKSMNGLTCTYTTSERDLQIFCPVSGLQLNFTVNPPTQYNNTICEGQVDIDFTLDPPPLPPFLSPIAAPGVSIQWLVNNTSQSSCSNMPTCHFVGFASFPMLSIQVVIQNGSCPPITLSLNIPVDKAPVCGVIDQMSGLTPTPTIYEYEICPGDDAILGMLNTAAFQNCNPVWQFHFDTDPPLSPNWQNLGGSNPIQLTNVLPQLSPPNNSSSPYLWPIPPSVPVAARCIIYRLACVPTTLPNSGCDSCYSNEITICLKPKPQIPVITGGPSQFCLNASSVLNISPIPGAVNYTWYCNGANIASGSGLLSITTMKTGCYWVEVDDGCVKVISQKFCVEQCIPKAIIGCPQDNPCACNGLPITLDGCDSGDSCLGTGPLIYEWYVNGSLVGTGCQLIHTPDPNGTTYTLIVTNTIGCSDMASIYIKPCI